MIKCKASVVTGSIILALFGSLQYTFAQQQRGAIRRQVVKRLTEIKPKDSKEFLYRVVAPSRTPRLPECLQLDLVNKIGHYRWSLVALRFERKRGEPFVDVSQVVFGSSLFGSAIEAVADSYGVKHGKLTVQEFDDLLSLAYALYNADITRKYIGPANKLGGSIAASSADGLILCDLVETSNTQRAIMRDSGTLAAGDLSRRVIGGFGYVRLHLFWEVFHDYFRNHPLTDSVVGSDASKLLISRLNEPPIADDYKEYFRLSLYACVLGEIGEPEAIPTLEKMSQSSRLTDNWNDYLREQTVKAIEKIKARN